MRLLRQVYGSEVLRPWLKRNGTPYSTLIVKQQLERMILEAAHSSYDVMLTKMLRTVPQSQNAHIMSWRDDFGMTVLHCTVNFDCIGPILHSLTGFVKDTLCCRWQVRSLVSR